MLIAIDGNEANIEKRAGVNWYAYEILWNIYKLQDEWKGDLEFEVFLKEKPLQDLPKETRGWHYAILKPGKGPWVLTGLMPRLFFKREKIKLLFSPSHYTVPLAAVPRICSIMDLGYLKFSDQFKKKTFWQLKYWTAISIFVSKRIIAISKATAKDIVRQYPFASKKVVVTQLAFDKTKFNNKVSDADVRRIKIKYSIVDDYILFLSTLKPSKNIEGLLEAFASIITRLPNGQVNHQSLNVKLVIAGKKGWMYETIFAKIQSLGLKDKVIFTDYLPEDDKPALLKGAKMLISPSFWEGFGLHVLEAMACGTPVVVSDRGSLPEIIGNAGILVDPNSVDSIAAGMKKVLSLSEKGYNQLRMACLKQAEKFSWQKTARETLEIIRETAKK